MRRDVARLWSVSMLSCDGIHSMWCLYVMLCNDNILCYVIVYLYVRLLWDVMFSRRCFSVMFLSSVSMLDLLSVHDIWCCVYMPCYVSMYVSISCFYIVLCFVSMLCYVMFLCYSVMRHCASMLSWYMLFLGYVHMSCYVMLGFYLVLWDVSSWCYVMMFLCYVCHYGMILCHLPMSCFYVMLLRDVLFLWYARFLD